MKVAAVRAAGTVVHQGAGQTLLAVVVNLL